VPEKAPVVGDLQNPNEGEQAMSNTQNKRTNQTSKTPSHLAYGVRSTDDGRGLFTQIGAAWAHIDGKGFNIHLDANPVDGHVALRVSTERKE
jgi:hypothetical protein